MSQLEKRWTDAAAEASALGLGEFGLATLAQSVGLEWFRERGDEPLSFFLNQRRRRVMALRGFGTVRISRLCEIVERANQMWSPRKVLAEWGVPADFPCHLVRFSTRIRTFCTGRNLQGIGELLDEWEKLGAEKFLQLPNLGRKSVSELAAFFTGLRPGNHQKMASFLPLDPSGRGLSLGRALAIVLEQRSPSEKILIQRRLVEKVTLSGAAQADGITKERVRQIVGRFLNEVRCRIEYFSEEHRRLLDAWSASTDRLEPLRQVLPGEDEVLLGRALEAVFLTAPLAAPSGG